MSKFRLTLFVFLLLMAASLLLMMTGIVNIAVPAWLALLFVAILSYAAFDIRLNFYLPSINTFKTDSREVAITIDDSPSGDRTLSLLEVLKKHDVKASFFCIGKNIEQHPESFKAIADHGHFIGNHSYAHENLMPFWDRKKLIADYARTAELLSDIKHRNTFRPPFGITNPNIAFALKALNLKSIGWTIRSLDTKIHHAGRINERIMKRIKPGSILLFHDFRPVTVKVLDELIPQLKERNYTFITANEIIARHT